MQVCMNVCHEEAVVELCPLTDDYPSVHSLVTNEDATPKALIQELEQVNPECTLHVVLASGGFVLSGGKGHGLIVHIHYIMIHRASPTPTYSMVLAHGCKYCTHVGTYVHSSTLLVQTLQFFCVCKCILLHICYLLSCSVKAIILLF